MISRGCGPSKVSVMTQTLDLDEFNIGPPRKRRKGGSSKGVWRRKICPPERTTLPTVRLSFEWNADRDDVVPTFLEVSSIHSDFSVMAGNIAITIPQHLAIVLRRCSPNIKFIFESSTKTELNLLVAILSLPFANAGGLLEAAVSKQYSCYNYAYTKADSCWQDFFKELEILQKSRQSPQPDMQLEELKPILRDYQAAAVGWMLNRERSPGSLDLSWMLKVCSKFTSSNGHILMYNNYTGTLYPKFASIPLSSGGILADEMGLGKTVVTLALLLHNKRVDFDTLWNMIPTCTEEEPKKKRQPVPVDNEMSERQLNQENSLNATEQLQLVSCKPGRGVLKSKLEAWYESQLAGVRVTPRKARNYRRSKFKCTCGDEEGIRKEVVTCSSCKLIQHTRCSGYDSDHLYVCPSCWKTQKPVPSKTTLIIVPPAILIQWANEIKTHTPSLQAFLYYGIKDKFVQPFTMAKHDVVITSYNVLRTETLYTVDTGPRSLRDENRFLRSSSPLARVSWWRIVCDEAQLVESDLSLVRHMTDLLQSVHRWCVTGTPIQKGISDLYYLTSFMGLGNFDGKNVWTDFLLRPYIAGLKTPLHSILSQVFWRSTKEVVEASLPEQKFELHYLKFTAIEQIFYMQQDALSSKKFEEGLLKSGLNRSLPLQKINKNTLGRLLQPLLNVRQACTHPQVVSGITINSTSGAANLADLSDYLCKKAKQECEEALRCHVAALNGLAGLLWFEDVLKALECYRSVFRLAEECRGAVQVDVLQRIHALTNASLILQDHQDRAPPTLHDANLKSDAEELEKKYLSKSEDLFQSSYHQAENLAKEVLAIRHDFQTDPASWWNPVVLSLYDHEKELIDKLAEELSSNDHVEKAAANTFINKIKTLRRVEFTIKKWWESLEDCYKNAKQAMEILLSTERKKLVEEALYCHLRLVDEGIQCTLCSVEKSLQDLECELFATTRKVIQKREKGIDGAETKGSWKPHYVERTLSIVFNLARGKGVLEDWCVRDGRQHLKLLEAMKKEFKQIRAVWTALNHCIHAEDELTMAKQRIRLSVTEPNLNSRKSKTRVAPKGENLLELHPYQIPDMMQVFETDRDVALRDFTKKKGRMMYLETLSKDRNATVDLCPICQYPLEQQWCVIYCGHCLCVPCMQKMLGGKPKRLKCPICREYTMDSDINFVDIAGNAEARSDIDVIGDYSTKVDSIVREVLRLVKKDSTVKILIFSTWKEVLKILSQALEANHVSFASLPNSKHQEILKKFLDRSHGITALLLPLAWGSKGLNLIEATHVFLVEPILNPAEELQAIGRVHRIGQTRPTVVHRFVVKRSIEEKIFEAVSEAKDTWSNKAVTLNDLRNLFFVPVPPTT